MFRPQLHSLLITLIICAQSLVAQTNTAYTKKDILKHLQVANSYFMSKWPDAGKDITVKEVTRPSNIWTRAVYYEGLMALYAIDKNKSYLNYTLQWGAAHKWGLRKGIETRNADNQCCGQTYYDVYKITKNADCIKDIKASVDLMLNTEQADDWNWIDALQMAMPVFVRLGNEYKDHAYYDKMYELYAYTKYKHGTVGLYNTNDKLWWRDKDFVAPYKEPNGEDCYWSRGNGWVVAALVRVLEKLPKTDPHYNEYLQDYKDLLQALLPLQRKDGLWNVSLHDSTNYGGKEITGTSLFIYGMAWGITNKILDKKIYEPVITKAYTTIVKEALHTNGFLGYVQGTGKEPKDGQPVTLTSVPDFEDYGLGCFLLAGTEFYKLKK